jgi:hypothetical protein
MIYAGLKHHSETPLYYQYTHTQEKEGNEGKTGLFWAWVPVGRDGHKERVNGGEYGECILYSYMKIDD